MKAKTDCYAYNDVIKDGGCFALKVMNCENCSFYKKTENPKAAQKSIMYDCKCYTGAADYMKKK